MEKTGRVLGVLAGLGIAAFWTVLSFHPNSGGARYVLIASSMILAALIGVAGGVTGRSSLLFAAFAVSVPSAAYFLLVESVYRGIGYLTPLLLVAGLMIYLSQRRVARHA